MLTLLLGPDWVVNRDAVLNMVASDVAERQGNRILLVPDMISHDMERRLCSAAGDTTSLYAEVMSFTRLVRSVSEYTQRGTQPCLDNGGRLVAMASATRQLHSRLKAYAAVETKPEFLIGLIETVDECKQACVTAEDLMDASSCSEGSLAQKLEELSLVMEAYDGICLQGKRDPADLMTWLLSELESCSYAQEHTFFIDGFPDFTRQHTEILRHLILHSPNVVISLTCDKPDSKIQAFERAGKTASQMIRLAKQHDVPMEIRMTEPAQTPLSQVRSRLFQGNTDLLADPGCLMVYKTNSVYQECVAAAQRIRRLTESGCRYRDISVVCSDPAAYRNTLCAVFSKFQIPIYLSGSDDILEKPVIHALLSSLDAALGGFEQREILRYLKSMISPLDDLSGDLIENYVILWDIQGTTWTKPWTMHPEGLGKEWNDDHKALLAKLNGEKDRAILPLLQLRDHFRNAVNLRQQVTAVYEFLNHISLPQTLERLSKQMECSADRRSAQIFDQLWEILLCALEQLYDVLGNTVWDAETFTRLLKLLLSRYDVGTIPPVLDAVLAGSVSAMRCQEVKHLILIGASEGCLPQYPVASGVLSEQERNSLRSLGVNLNAGAMDGLQREFSEIYDVFCGARETAYVSVSSAQPSFVCRRLSEMAGGMRIFPDELGTAAGNRWDACAWIARQGDEAAARELNLFEEFVKLRSCADYRIGRISSDGIRSLYGDLLKLSASQVDKQANCRLAYFLHYGLKAKERKAATVDPAEFGTYVHDVLEKTGREVIARGGFRKVSLEETLKIAKQHSDAYISQKFSDIDSTRQNYLLGRNREELYLVVEELWNEMQISQFQPVDFEVSFGDGKQLEAIEIPGGAIRAKLRGFVDRVDIWKDGDINYFRIVDYKTGKKAIDFCDILNGIGLQMLLYLYGLEDKGEPILGKNPTPAGVQYFPARVPVISMKGVPTDEQAELERQASWKRKGILLQDQRVVSAMQGKETAKAGVKISEDGDVTGDVASAQQLRMLKGYIFKVLGEMVDEIASGNVDANPYFRGPRENACRFCPFGDVCHGGEPDSRRNFAAVSYRKFWEEIEKEMKEYG